MIKSGYSVQSLRIYRLVPNIRRLGAKVLDPLISIKTWMLFSSKILDAAVTIGPGNTFVLFATVTSAHNHNISGTLT
jgi:hypothetical protein